MGICMRRRMLVLVLQVGGPFLAAMLAIMGLGASRALADPGGEFLNPSPNGPPAASIYNTTPTSCPVTEATPFCDILAPSSSLPPLDVNNPEFLPLYNLGYLNSAYWPAEKRPDIEMYAIEQYGYGYQNCGDPSTSPHYCFLVDAEAVGYPVTHTPQAGDLFLSRCESIVYVNPNATADCSRGNIYYVGYVDQVFSDGSFVVTEGGSTTAADSGIGSEWLSGSMDSNSDFIGFFPSGQSPHLPSTPVGVVIYSGGAGSGSVRDSNGQTCATNSTGSNECWFTEPQGVPITFTETTQAGSRFGGWTGSCSGFSTSCTITVSKIVGAGLTAAFDSTESDAGAGSSGSGAGGKSGTGTGKPPAGKRLRIARVTTSRGTIHATLQGSHLTCKLARWTGHGWASARTARCGGSVTYRHLTAGRYRLLLVSGKLSATKIVILRHGMPAATHKPRHSARHPAP